MKYLQDDALTRLTARLQECRMGQRMIQGRIEAFTMKRAGNDKKYAADLGSKYVEQQETFENEWKQLVAASAWRGGGNKNLVVTDDDASHNKQQKRRRSQSVGVCQDLAKEPVVSRGAKHARSSSFDGLSQQYELQQQITPLGDLRDLSTRRLMTDLILTLNMSFPDYDFSNVQPRDFQSVPLQDAMQDVYSQLSPFLCNGNEADVANNSVNGTSAAGNVGEDMAQPVQSSFIVDLWNALDQLMQLKECDVYAWNSGDMSSEELWLWSFHYFFVNKTLKRVVFFTCNESMQDRLSMDGSGDEDDEEDVVAPQPIVERQQVDDMDSVGAGFDLDPSAAQAGGFSLGTV
jgi:hypothetical protein